jgi:hypothetical protein
LIPAKAALYVKYSANLKYGNPESFLLNFLPLPFFFAWFRKPFSLPNTINESASYYVGTAGHVSTETIEIY